MKLAGDFATELNPGDSVFLIGELGAGKTTFTRGVVGHFDSDIQVSSPSFAIVNSYPTVPPIHHVDLYRIVAESDLADLGLDELLDSGGIVIIEWAEKCSTLQPKRLYRVSFVIMSESERHIQIEATGNDTGA